MKRIFTLILFVFTALVYPILAAEPLQNMPRLGSITPQASNKIIASPWGIQFAPVQPHVNVVLDRAEWPELEQRIETLLDKSAALGIKWARVSFNWVTVVDENGEFHWDYPDKILHGLTDCGIIPYVCFHGGHPEFSDRQAPTVSPEAMDAWLEFVAAMVKRYADRIDYWELWNEPNYVSFWKPKPDARDYARLIKETAPLIRDLDPGCKILGGSLARVDLDFARLMLAYGAGPHLDAFTVHPYNAEPEGSWQKISYPVQTPQYYMRSSNSMAELQQMLQAQPQPIPLWQGECGYPSEAHSMGWFGLGPWGERIQAKWVLRRLLIDAIHGLPVSAYFMIVEIQNTSGRVNFKGLLEHEDLSEKPAYYTLQNLAALVQGQVQPDSTPVELEIIKHGDFYGVRESDLIRHRLKANIGELLLYWLPWHPQERVQPGAVKIQTNFKEPVCIDLIDGAVYEMPENQAPLADYPMIIAERKAIESMLK